MDQRLELFYVGDFPEPVGVLATRTGDGRTDVRIRFSIPDGPTVDTSVDISFAGSITDWQTFRSESDGETVEGARDDVTATVNSQELTNGGTLIPSYGLSVLIEEVLDRGVTQYDFLLLNESDGAVNPARLEFISNDSVESPPCGRYTDCTRVELTVADRRTNTYWVKDGTIVVSDWAGARSYLLPEAATGNLPAVLA